MATVDLTVANFLCKNMYLGWVYIFSEENTAPCLYLTPDSKLETKKEIK